MKGNLREFQGLLDRKSMIQARDQVGATPLHKAVLYGHYELAEYIATNFPATLDARDNVSVVNLKPIYFYIQSNRSKPLTICSSKNQYLPFLSILFMQRSDP